MYWKSILRFFKVILIYVPSIERGSFADEWDDYSWATGEAGISSEAAEDPFFTRRVQRFLAARIGNNMFKLNKLKLFMQDSSLRRNERCHCFGTECILTMKYLNGKIFCIRYWRLQINYGRFCKYSFLDFSGLNFDSASFTSFTINEGIFTESSINQSFSITNTEKFSFEYFIAKIKTKYIRYQKNYIFHCGIKMNPSYNNFNLLI